MVCKMTSSISRSFLLKFSLKKVLCSQRYLRNKWRKIIKEVQISLDTMHYFGNFFSKSDREIESIILHTINHRNSTKWVKTFLWIFHFLLLDFSKKIIEHFFHKCLMPNALGICEIIYKVQKEENIFWGESWFPLQNARTRARLLYHIGEVWKSMMIQISIFHPNNISDQYHHHYQLPPQLWGKTWLPSQNARTRVRLL